MTEATATAPAARSRPAGADGATSGPSRLTLPVLLAGVFITTLDFFIVNVAIPDTQAGLRASSSAMQWVVAGFGLAFGAGLITAGRLGDMLGRRQMYLAGLLTFMVASLACGLAPDIGALLTGRVVQGIAAACTVPQAVGTMNIVYTGPRRARAFAAYGLSLGLAAVFGQLIGGALIEADIAGSGWRSIYLINVPVCLVTAVFVPRVVPRTRGDGHARLDVPGVLLASAAIVALVLPLVQGRQDGWPAWTWASLALAVLLGVGFVGYQRRLHRSGGAPLVEPQLFRARSFAVGSLVAMVYMLAMSSFFLTLALLLQDGHGLSPLDSGLVFGVLGAAYLLASTQASRVGVRLGRQVIALGAVVQLVGYLLLALVVNAYGVTGSVGVLLAPLAVIGVGMGFAVVPLPPMALSQVEPRHASAGSGVLSTAQQVGAAIGVALVGIVFYGRLDGTAHSFGPAFQAALLLLAGCCALAGLAVQLLPGRRG
jgi:EmrB/QacA subfamily drug resistance transporter